MIIAILQQNKFIKPDYFCNIKFQQPRNLLLLLVELIIKQECITSIQLHIGHLYCVAFNNVD